MAKLYLLQSRFAWSLSKLILYAEAAGYHVTFGRVYESEAANKANGGIAGSLHTQRLAADLNLFSKDGKYLTKTEDYRPLGDYWKGQGDDYAWGGDFPKPDGNHFSIAHGGKK